MDMTTSKSDQSAGSSAERHYWMYVLKLEENKYYVGVTSKTPEHRFQQHLNGFAGAAWTRKYKPLAILDKKDLGLMTLERAEAYENKVVRRYMRKKGLENVRGGDISTPEELVNRFGRLITKDGWEGVTLTTFLLFCLLNMYFLYYTKK